MSSAAASPVYYEGSWAILSTIGIANTLYGMLVVGITNLTPLTSIPIVVSVAVAIANGLCFYSYYADYPLYSRLVASAFADVFWLIQEAGLPFYSFFILLPILRDRPRKIFLTLFWLGTISTVAFRTGILVCRVRLMLSEAGGLQSVVNYLHVGYYASIALVEIVGAVFLLRIFAQAKKMTSQLPSPSSLFGYLMRSTELRIALLALLGIARSVTHSFQTEAQAATGLASQLDRFVYTLQCMFPVMLMIDVLASRVVHNKDTHSMAAARGRAQEEHIGLGPISQGSGRKIQDGDHECTTASHHETRGRRPSTGGSSTKQILGPSDTL
ncbi:hypothetical protein MKZ38_005768 [Zalerion maritima]|uniref:Uncharacterized protein n=1 Tax=Zalerion maritima TaxID=339359 RepID=A0AAD5RJM8_9PEZI|nr:hypothetical protein MKZ38_005768 [Zalerion maritima]